LIGRVNKLLGLCVLWVLAGLFGPAVEAADLLQDAGSWLQVVGEGSLKFVDPSLKKAASGWKVNPAGTMTGIIGTRAWHARRWATP
jgi:hypothetical protein